MKKLLLLSPMVLFASSLAIADPNDGFYTGGGLAYWTLSEKNTSSSDVEDEEDVVDPEDVEDEDNASNKFHWTAVEWIGGYKHNPYVGVETRIGYGFDDPSIAYISAYYRMESQNETAKSYLLFGYSYANLIGLNESDTGISGLSYGAGIGFPVGRQLFFNMEYRMLLDSNRDNLSMQGLSMNIDYRF